MIKLTKINLTFSSDKKYFFLNQVQLDGQRRRHTC